MYYIVWFLWISDICQTSLCFSTKVQDYDPYRSWAGSQYGRWELPTSKSKWATWVRISQIYLHWSGSKSTRELRRNSNAHLMTEKSNGSAKVLTNVFLCLLTFDRDAIVENDKLRKWPLFYCFCSPAGSPSTTPERALWAPGLPWARNTPAQDSQLPGVLASRVWSLVWIWSQLNIMIKDGSSLYYPRSSFSMQYTSLQSKPYSNSRYFSSAGPLYHRTIAIHWTIGPSDHWRIILTDLCCRPSSRNGKYTNGVAGGGGGYPGIQNMAYSPAYSNGVSYLQHSGIAFTFLGDKHFHKFTCVTHLHF